MNSHHPSVKLTANIQENENEFLDISIFKGPSLEEKGQFDTKVYFKPTDTHQLLHKSSFHPRHTFRGILKSQIIRFNKICSQKNDLDNTCSILFRALRSRGYTSRSLRYIKNQTLDEIKSGKLIKPPGISFDSEDEHFSEPCDRLHCHTCEYVRECDSVKSNTNNFVFKLCHDLDCNSRNIILQVILVKFEAMNPFYTNSVCIITRF